MLISLLLNKIVYKYFKNANLTLLANEISMLYQPNDI